VPKPKDWGPEIDIAGFVFLDLASTFEPPKELLKFLDAGDPPVYIGFGSIVVDDPDRFTQMIFEAVEQAGVRALVSKGWGGLGDDNVPDNIFMLENTPHDWLFPKVKAVVHHGGAGTTAIGLKCGKPTMVVPFFGDQPFWGKMIAQANAGADPVPYKHLTVEKLAEGIKQCLTDEVEQAAKKIAESIEAEGDGARNAVASFHRSLVLKGQHSLRCSILDDRVAVWSLKNTKLRLSALAAELLVERRRISWRQLRLIRHNEWNDFEGPGEPLTGAGTAILGTLTGIASGVGSVPFRLAKSSRKRTRHEEKKRRQSEQGPMKKSGSGRDTIADGNGGINDTITGSRPLKPPGQNVNGRMRKPTSEPPNGTTNIGLANIAKINTPVKGMEAKATHGPDLGKHTSNGEPMANGNAANRQDEDENAIDTESELSDEPQDTAVEEIAHDVGGGIGRTAEALAKAPMDLALAVAQGFHNAPRLYGDTTVRR
jgi:hypothetical protein